jgi:hypothetical protein
MKDVKQYTEYSICIDIVNKINVKTGEITHAVQYYCYISAMQGTWKLLRFVTVITYQIISLYVIVIKLPPLT